MDASQFSDPNYRHPSYPEPWMHEWARERGKAWDIWPDGWGLRRRGISDDAIKLMVTVDRDLGDENDE